MIIELLPDTDGPLVVALDGRSGTGKSAAAAAVRDRLGASHAVTILEGDTFYRGGSATTWEQRSPDQNVDEAFDWRRQREVLRALKDGEQAVWRSFDWGSSDWDSDTPPFEDEVQSASPADVIVLEGVYAARPQNSDLVDVRVLIDLSEDARRLQLLEREGVGMKHDWERRWSKAEDHYFAEVMTPSHFDVVIRPDTDGRT